MAARGSTALADRGRLGPMPSSNTPEASRFSRDCQGGKFQPGSGSVSPVTVTRPTDRGWHFGSRKFALDPDQILPTPIASGHRSTCCGLSCLQAAKEYSRPVGKPTQTSFVSAPSALVLTLRNPFLAFAFEEYPSPESAITLPFRCLSRQRHSPPESR